MELSVGSESVCPAAFTHTQSRPVAAFCHPFQPKPLEQMIAAVQHSEHDKLCEISTKLGGPVIAHL